MNYQTKMFEMSVGLLDNLAKIMQEQSDYKRATTIQYLIVNPAHDDEENDTATIFVKQVQKRLPFELLIKIYTEYFRPHKYAQIYHHIMNGSNKYHKNTVMYQRLFEYYVKYFLHSSTNTLLCFQDPAYDKVTQEFKYRGSSVFVKADSKKIGLFMELWMNKYH